ncbi:MAG: ABC transporter ATP-binding protein, partial [Desulfobulbaceae bacterium]|nr:ABC transporter ATP-binding protein [Desulfobulbaceae bacterium]
RALVQDPEVLLLDEATSNLDIFHSLSILGTIRSRIREQGLTVVAALHDLNLATFFCDQLIFIKNGKMVCQGPIDQVLRAEIIHQVYGVEAEVRQDAFSGCRQVSYKMPDSGLTQRCEGVEKRKRETL